jgi:virulence-associated protein VagC
MDMPRKRTSGIAKVVRSGQSQIVRFPIGFQLPGAPVMLRRKGDAVVIAPMRPKTWPRGYWSRLRTMKADFRAGPMTLRLRGVED